MVLQDLLHICEHWAPPQLAWERDNVGLQAGARTQRIRKVLVTLDVTDTVIDEAQRKRVDLLISHHPLIFEPLRSICRDERTGRLLAKLVKAGIALYVLHTNLDFTRGGVSFSLAEKLSLQEVKVLHPESRRLKKIVVYTPESHAARLTAAMAGEGAGVIGSYDFCSFRSEGIGTFRPGKGADPYLGKIGRIESVNEVRLEMVVPSWNLEGALRAMRAAHPYDEVACDVFDLATASSDYGAGVIGKLPRAMPLRKFLSHVKRSLGVPFLRYAAGTQRTVQTVAVCGGSGSDLLPAAIGQGAGALVTADITYHKFQKSDGNITLIDAGHYETEHPVLQTVVGHLRRACAARREKIQIAASSTSTNVVQYSLA